MTKLERFKPFRKIELAVGQPMPPATVTPDALRDTITAMRGEAK